MHKDNVLQELSIIVVFVCLVYSEQHAALVSCLGSLLSVVLIQIFIPSQTKRVVPVKTQEGRLTF